MCIKDQWKEQLRSRSHKKRNKRNEKNVSINRPLLVVGEENSKTSKEKKTLDTNLDLFDEFNIIFILLLLRFYVDGGWI